PFAVDPPVAKSRVALAIQTPSEPHRKQSPQLFLGVWRSRHPAQDFGRAVALILAPAMCPVDLVVVVRDPPVVRLAQLGPGNGLSEAPVGHPPLDVEGGLDVGL